MSKILNAALCIGALATVSPSSAAAQGSFLKNLARQAAAAAIQNAAQAPAQAGATPDAESAPVEASGDQPPAEEAPATGPAPWPVNLGSRSVTSPMRLEFSPETKAAKDAFLEFSKVRCNDCEGGYAYDAWAQHHVKVGYEYNAFHNKVGGLAMGQSITWTGAAATGSITVVGETPIKGWRCKQLKWELKKGTQRAERPGLYCVSPSSAGTAKENWLDVF
ncbi:hypothetical protein [Phenylobacterium kunshanense]|uniref:Uncharacterized protein n=1 Tax=Phenylobacterium kunshanense TaxID=1445034 RepID=A0A328BK81_9CAUL|nr:hypothetical protein [Phenylobacterium kunshanense]RAK65378.1 hypothetical protein DJ019_10415 [Phenylobacterium kunshanense]